MNCSTEQHHAGVQVHEDQEDLQAGLVVGEAPVHPQHSAHQLDWPGSALPVGGHVKYEEESENNILKYLIVFNCVILKCNVVICLAVSVLNK